VSCELRKEDSRHKRVLRSQPSKQRKHVLTTKISRTSEHQAPSECIVANRRPHHANLPTPSTRPQNPDSSTQSAKAPNETCPRGACTQNVRLPNPCYKRGRHLRRPHAKDGKSPHRDTEVEQESPQGNSPSSRSPSVQPPRAVTTIFAS